MITEIVENGVKRELFVEVEEKYANYLCNERSDAFLVAILPVALREGYDIICEAPVSEMLLHNIKEILIPHLVKYDSSNNFININTDIVSEYIGGDAVGTAISCGVDSTYTVMKYTQGRYNSLKLTHLFIASVNAELWDFEEDDNLYTWEQKHLEAFNRFNFVSEKLNLPLVKVFTNIIWYVCKRDWKKYHHLWVHTYITMGTVLALKKLWKCYYFSSAEDFSNFTLINNAKEDPAKYELLLMHVLSCNDFICLRGGVSVSREQKTHELADYPVAQKVLHPCHKQGIKNCTEPTCHKCLRALGVLDYYDKLDLFQEVFDIDRYKKEKKHYLWRLAQARNDFFIRPVFLMMQESILKK